MLSHRLDRKQRYPTINRCHLISDCADESVRITRGANHERHAGWVLLRKRVIEIKPRIFGQGPVLTRLHHPYHFQCIPAVNTNENALAYCALSRPERLGHLLVNDNYAFCFCLVAVVKISTFNQGNLHGLEVPRANNINRNVAAGTASRQSLAFLEYWSSRTRTIAKWQQHGAGGRFHARQILCPLQHL